MPELILTICLLAWIRGPDKLGPTGWVRPVLCLLVPILGLGAYLYRSLP